MMEVETIRRYPNYDSLIVDLETAQKSASRGPAVPAAAPRKKKSRARMWIVGNTISLLILAGAWIIVSGRKEKPKPVPQPPPRPTITQTNPAPSPSAPTAKPAKQPTKQPAAPLPAPEIDTAPQETIADDASAYAGWTDGMSGGAGLDPWTLKSGPDAGFFLGSSKANTGKGSVDTMGKAWGLFAHSNDTASAWRRFSGGPLAVGSQRFEIDFDHGQVGKGGPSVGLGLQNGASNTLWEFYFSGGSKTYVVHDADGHRDSGIPYTTDGIHINFQLTSPTEYVAEIAAGLETKKVTGRLVDEPDQQVRVVRLWNFNAGDGSKRDIYFNRIAVLPVRRR
jgi:hypothetical protein